MPAYKTQRELLLAAWDELEEDFVLSTMPYQSVGSFEFEVVESDATSGVAMAVCRANQEVNFYDFGKGDRITQGANTQHRANRADTNLSKGKSTNGASDFVIEGIAFAQRGFRCSYDTFDWPVDAAPTDVDVVAAFAGKHPWVDPGSHVVPPQVSSPYNLENAAFQGILGYCSLVLNFDENTIKPLGTLDMLPQGGAASYLRANGEPRSDNRFRIDEGYIWRREGKTDGEFYATVKTEEAVVMPIDLLADPDQTTQIPNSIYLDVVMRVYGIEVEGVSSN